MSLIQEVSLSKDDINVIISALTFAHDHGVWEDLDMENQSEFFGADTDRYFSHYCGPHKRAMKLAQLLKWSGDLKSGHRVCKMKFSSLNAEVFKHGRPVQEGVGVDKPDL
jgi:hypothetical protein